MTSRSLFVLGTPLFVFFCAACQESLSPPFDQLKAADMTVYRLQNFEPPPAPTAAVPTIPGLPGNIQIPDLVNKGQELLKSWGLPPIPGLPALGGGAPAPDNTQRFYAYRILAVKAVGDPDQKSDSATLFGTPGNFSDKSDTCMYPEFGVAILNPANGQHFDLAVSASCAQVRALNFQWPYAQIGVPPSTSRKLVEIVKRVFDSQSVPPPVGPGPGPVPTGPAGSPPPPAAPPPT